MSTEAKDVARELLNQVYKDIRDKPGSRSDRINIPVMVTGHWVRTAGCHVKDIMVFEVKIIK